MVRACVCVHAASLWLVPPQQGESAHPRCAADRCFVNAPLSIFSIEKKNIRTLAAGEEKVTRFVDGIKTLERMLCRLARKMKLWPRAVRSREEGNPRVILTWESLPRRFKCAIGSGERARISLSDIQRNVYSRKKMIN